MQRIINWKKSDELSLEDKIDYFINHKWTIVSVVVIKMITPLCSDTAQAWEALIIVKP